MGGQSKYCYEGVKMKKEKRACPCCGCFTLDEPPGNYDICPVCFWEDDSFDILHPDEESACNHISLNQARVNYKLFGACDEDMKKYVRKPKAGELRTNMKKDDK